MKRKIVGLTRSKFALQALDSIFCNPVFRRPDFVRFSGISKPSAARILGVLEKERILLRIRRASGRRPATLMFAKLIEIVEGSRLSEQS
jgi:hypothetical protein